MQSLKLTRLLVNVTFFLSITIVNFLQIMTINVQCKSFKRSQSLVCELLLGRSIVGVFNQPNLLNQWCVFFCHGNALTGGRDTTEIKKNNAIQKHMLLTARAFTIWV